MRRGRLPATSAQPATQSTKPSPSPMRISNGDPFAALDSSSVLKGADELSNKFPTLDQFSILHEKGMKFDFEGADISQTANSKSVDEAFAPVSNRQTAEIGRGARMPSTSPERKVLQAAVKSASAPPRPVEMSRASSIIKNTPELQAISSGSAQAFQPSPTRPNMVSTGTMTTPPPERQLSTTATSQYPIYRFPSGDHHRSSSLGRPQEANISLPIRTDSPSLRPSASPRIPSYQGHSRQPSSSRPSLEGGRPNLEPELLHKTKSMSGRSRPASTYLESNLDFLREQERNSKPHGSPGLPPSASSDLLLDEDMNIESNVDFLRSMEESQPSRRSMDGKRSSLTSLGKKSIFAGKFGDAFKRFESSQPGGAPEARTPSPFKPLDRNELTPIAGSEATDGRSDDGQALGDVDEPTPEMRREIEQRQLEEEEKRVSAAQAAYRAKLAQRGEGGKPTPPPVSGSSRAISIQSKVQSLLDENARSATNVKRTAEGYGQYTEPAAESAQPVDSRPEVPRKPVGTGRGSTSTTRPMSSSTSLNQVAALATGVDSSRPVPQPKDMGSRPMAPPKPGHLNRTGTNGSSSSSNMNILASSPPQAASINTTGMRQTGRLEALVAADLPGQPALDMTAQEKDDYLRDFSKRFPSLTSIEMVERDLAAEENTRPGR